MVAITGPQLRRHHEVLALGATALAAVLTVVVPVAYVLALPAACAATAAAAPAGRRLAASLTVWVPLSIAAAVGSLPLG